METTTLYRPVGQRELELIAESGYTAFPPRLAGQPIFYPVLTEEYARHIAERWNTDDEFSGYVGHVLRFEVGNDFLARYEVQKVGDRTALEYWIPAGELPEFNRQIVGRIELVASYRREGSLPNGS
ncbi:hypothetical protein SAMN05421819_1933 [Bryocella elongata]|uniref:ADP-ribosylation/crystallin J1 n=1 Tax=Bryocella elongata TaxID=863522 RepID=A0A1H5XR65_9BACT|nr:hypothetical protein [Bryocella elongata]SEG14162.1 hypothetical protein SAMN05421819_1933 [Bryocella elongata]